jgi:hypothetical protein
VQIEGATAAMAGPRRRAAGRCPTALGCASLSRAVLR